MKNPAISAGRQAGAAGREVHAGTAFRPCPLQRILHRVRYGQQPHGPNGKGTPLDSQNPLNPNGIPLPPHNGSGSRKMKTKTKTAAKSLEAGEAEALPPGRARLYILYIQTGRDMLPWKRGHLSGVKVEAGVSMLADGSNGL